MVSLDDKLELAVGARTAKALAAALDLHTVGDLVHYYPRRYAERGELTDIAGLEIGEHATVLARVKSVNERRMRQRRGWILEVVITDGTRTLNCTFFNMRQHSVKLKPGVSALFAGKVSIYQNKLQLTNPEYQPIEQDQAADDGGEAAVDTAIDDFLGLIPVYPAAAKVQSWQVAKCVRQTLGLLDTIEDPMPEELREGRMSFDEAVRAIHSAKDWAGVNAARGRLKWGEALAVQLALAQRRAAATARPAPACPRRADGIQAEFDQRLPFELTSGQREVGEVIAEDLAGRHPMNRLLQGEVGSGKTVVALRAMLQVVDAGRQAALLAPTEVLAAQHARSLAKMLGDLAQAGELGAAEHATRVALLTGSLPAAQRKQVLLDVVSGAAGIVVGTHALIQDRVEFADLALVVVDEQHRFGVEQRDALRTRAGENVSPHVLVMTATPIPRTVAMTVYGDLETSSLRELPAGRSPISTAVVPAAEKPTWLDRAWQRLREEVAEGHQAYVVCPRIGEKDAPEDVDQLSDQLSDEALDEMLAGSESARRPPLAVLAVAEELAAGPLEGLRLAVLHGRLPTDEKDAVMRAFAAGEVDVLVATTVVEVGVDVPNATAMVIMDADRFGVSQLHQLRGRVGRGSAAGVCLLVTDALAGTATRDRLDAVASTLDGFELAQVDLEMRREGDILGATQSGKHSQLKLLSLLRDAELITEAREVAQRLVTRSPDLREHPGLARMVANLVGDSRAEYLEKV
ncbi:ATP-dependent DNA helicase RecG [Actinophytocola xanthii]|uniref:ATP-dependent DNA helicase RecG n=1 Tax=Actinophytocola xanthii TaxID=1912961 RepID=A0A1Q8C5K3_9PSEU|nr:ATP-dependent DNA helicase RecG [Actinophytocola xanthii]OLF09641.1 ATP-dependent DNA helicase RecG [Actinophytocola xanthii]